jgi:succinyl-CoA synthetase beta subunit
VARVKLTEFRAKSLLIDNYEGVALHLETLESDIQKITEGTTYIIKVDQGIKKRGKQGLIRLNVEKAAVATAVNELAEKGFQRFLAEPMFAHDDSEERYVSFERTRQGIAANYSERGGVSVEDSAVWCSRRAPSS